VRIGLFPGWGGTQRLAQLVGQGAASKLVLTGAPVSGEEAERIGLVNSAVPEEDLWTLAYATAEEVLQGGPHAVAAAKRAIRQAYETTLSTGLRFETEAWLVNFQSPDRLQGLSAFLNRESPPWT
ncbi:MAG: enoyl-CoA hydratase/isomerase family protein, partial [Stackebrandtia sp.]